MPAKFREIEVNLPGIQVIVQLELAIT